MSDVALFGRLPVSTDWTKLVDKTNIPKPKPSSDPTPNPTTGETDHHNDVSIDTSGTHTTPSAPTDIIHHSGHPSAGDDAWTPILTSSYNELSHRLAHDWSLPDHPLPFGLNLPIPRINHRRTNTKTNC